MTGGRLRAVAFDLDGTLVDLERLHHDSLLRAARDVGVELTWEQARRSVPNFIGGPGAVGAGGVGAPVPAGAPPAEILAAKQRYFTAAIDAVSQIVPRAGVGEILDRLGGEGVPLAVGTVAEREIAVGILDRAGLLPLFGEARVVTLRDVPRLKPAPDVYLETARRLGVPPADQLVFEDSLTGMAAARSAGSPFVAMPTVRAPDYLASVGAAGAAAVFRDWRDPGLLSLLAHLLATPGRVYYG
ncbi:HAD family phosphatase [Micromonospora sp. CPCC 205371]|nr:HAD family phosphatase [Micromonospora sp. CPCC 205371]